MARLKLFDSPFLFFVEILFFLSVTLILYFTARCFYAYFLLRKLEAPIVWWFPKFSKINGSKQRGQSLKRILHNMQTKKGPFQMYGTVFGGVPVLHIGDPEIARLVLQGTLKQPAYNHFKGFCGEGVFTADGDDWKMKRAAVLHSFFRKENLESIVPLANRAMDTLPNSISDGKEFNFVFLIQKHTLGLIYQYITGRPMHKEAVAERENYLLAVSKIRMVILAFSRSFWMFSRPIYYMFSSLAKMEIEAMTPIRKFAVQAIQNALPNAPLGKLSMKSSHSKNPEDMLDESITLLFAGQDTSAATLSWTIYLLSKNVLWQDILHKEVIQEAGETGHITANNVQNLQNIDAVIKETLRLFPVAPFVARQIDRDILLPNGKHIPAGVTAIVWIYAMHHNPLYWSEPECFKPTRWMKGTTAEPLNKIDADVSMITEGIKSQSFAYMPFALGPRACVGQNLAHIALRVILARIVRDWKITLCENQINKEMQVGFTVLPENGLWVRFEHRKSR